MLRQGSLYLLLASLITIIAVSTGCRRNTSEGNTLNVVGSTSIQPFAEALAQDYCKLHPGSSVDVQGGGSTAGIQAITNGLAQIGTCSRSLTPEEAKQFQEIVIARDGVAIVVHPTNPVSGLTMQQLRDVFSGKIANWKALGGRDEPIRTITREEGSGTRESFVHLVMGQEKMATSALVQESNGAVKTLIKGNPAAIGFISLGMVDQEIKALPIDNAQPNSQSVLEGRYKLVRPFLFVTKGEPSPDARKFIDYVLSPEGQKKLEAEGLIRAK